MTRQSKMKRPETTQREPFKVRRARVADIPVFVDHRRFSRQRIGLKKIENILGGFALV